MSEYHRGKERAREKAIEWQYSTFERVVSWWDLMTDGMRFERLARRYGLVREFRENGII